MNARCVRGGPYAPPACIDKVDDLTPERLTENVAFLDAARAALPFAGDTECPGDHARVAGCRGRPGGHLLIKDFDGCRPFRG